MSEDKKTSLDPKLQKILDQVAELSVLELSELVKALEKKFDVKAVAAAPSGAAAPVGAEGENPATAGIGEEKKEFEVVVTDAGSNKIGAIKIVREYKQDLGLKEAKDLVEAPPASLGVMKKEEAEAAKKKFEDAGATVELK